MFVGECVKSKDRVDCPFNEYFSFWTLIHLFMIFETMVIFFGIVYEQRAVTMYLQLTPESDTEIDTDAEEK